jgi:hypothetical protein
MGIRIYFDGLEFLLFFGYQNPSFIICKHLSYYLGNPTIVAYFFKKQKQNGGFQVFGLAERMGQVVLFQVVFSSLYATRTFFVCHQQPYFLYK